MRSYGEDVDDNDKDEMKDDDVQDNSKDVVSEDEENGGGGPPAVNDNRAILELHHGVSNGFPVLQQTLRVLGILLVRPAQVLEVIHNACLYTLKTYMNQSNI